MIDIGSGGKDTEGCRLLCIGAFSAWRIGITSGVTARRSAAASRRSAATTRRLVVASRGAAYGGTHLAHIGLVVEVGIAQSTRGTGTQLQSADVAGYVELGLGLGALLVADTHGEDGQVVNLHILASQELLLDTLHHGGHHAETHGLREAGVVFLHVLGEVGQVDGFIGNRKCIPLAECKALLVLVFL